MISEGYKANPQYQTLKPAQIILPWQDNDGRDLSYSHMALRSRLSKTWGGCTVLQGSGVWTDDAGKVYEEPVNVYVVAMVDAEHNRRTLREIAAGLAASCGQHCVYVQHARGDVEFVKANQHNALAA